MEHTEREEKDILIDSNKTEFQGLGTNGCENVFM